VPAQVSLLEPLGAETLVTLRIGSAEMVARCPASFRQPPGTALDVYMAAPHLHLFDAASGAAI
jgi:multiple sugar transport system ATP-binding protein